MPQTPHVERHFTAGERVRDVVIGMSDGVDGSLRVGGRAFGRRQLDRHHRHGRPGEIAAGSIAMGLGGYLAARSDAEHYASERVREELEVREKPAAEEAEVRQVLQSYGVTPEASTPIVDAFRERPEAWVDFMMRFELGLEKPDPHRALVSALTIAGAYIAGGFIPLGPYLIAASAKTALTVSVAVTLAALALFGYIKGHFTGTSPARSGLQTVLIGGLAAAAAFAIAKAIA